MKNNKYVKELFENKTTAIFDLNTILENVHDKLIESIDEVATENNMGWIKAIDYYIRGRALSVTWDFILNSPYVKTENIAIETLIKQTLEKFTEKITEDGLQLREGLEEFIEELKTVKGFKLILVSSYDETITSLILEAAILEDVFHIIEVTPQGVTLEDIYKGIIKKHKIQRETTIAFEEDSLISREITKKEITTVVVWDKETPREKFPKEVVLFIEDFSEFPGNMDKTYLETLEMVQEYTENPE